MKVSDFIVNFFIEKDITDVFGYPGGMVTHLMESFRQKGIFIRSHVNYHEQAAAFCACGYAQVSNKAGIAYATSGPGATNLVTGICNAYFDSIPTIFITGQVNTFESKKGLNVRQKGFQETNIVEMVKGVTKYSYCLNSCNEIKRELERAWYYANEGRKGPVLLDIPMNILSSDVEIEELEGYAAESDELSWSLFDRKSVIKLIKDSKHPVLLLGAGVKTEKIQILVEELIQKYSMPTVTSMLAFDVLEHNNEYNYGFIGAYGNRCANFLVAKCDLLLAIGTRLDVRQIGARKESFAPNAKLIRVEIDKNELTNKVKEDELQINCDAEIFLNEILKYDEEIKISAEWIEKCNAIKGYLSNFDNRKPNNIIQCISRKIEKNTVITTDVGQNQIWVAQSFEISKGQKVLFSGGHGAMGYSLPAAIGACYAKKGRVICFNGDGGIQMNIQELQFIVREALPITIIIMNNRSLGMIRHFQEMYFDSNYFQTTCGGGYNTPDFSKLAGAYGLKYSMIQSEADINKVNWKLELPQIVEVILDENTYVFPKLEFGKPNQDQEPLIDRTLFKKLMEL